LSAFLLAALKMSSSLRKLFELAEIEGGNNRVQEISTAIVAEERDRAEIKKYPPWN
jgi:hypothetical protein